MSKATIFVALALALALLVYRCTTPAATLRCRIVIEVDTPGGLKIGSSVMELVLKRPFIVPMPGGNGSESGGGFQLFGEAPFVNLGNQVLFMKYSSKDSRPEAEYVITDGLKMFARRRATAEDSNEAVFRELNRTKPLGEVAPTDFPVFATFADVTNPHSDTEFQAKSFQEHLGKGYAIKRITVQVVGKDVPLTSALTARFPALANKETRLSLSRK
ncbi:MAG: hypothetical protein K2W81_01735 [Sphingomonas sp.]|uniref:hypothetical protein n=1 Tax=Sphingomonas sp. TaxID=28214 RepID=UPI0025EBA6F5|nr:hypothetical protein [Sphingomonas sp.]MBY0282667.1 hypothetical protein [Sphingomonas sp.]